jgi:hypothetical protein
MRAKEILYEDYNQRLESDLNNLLIGAKGNGAQDINTQDLANQLQQMGYAVDPNSLMTLLQNNPSITNATPDSITLASPEGAEAGQEDDSASHVQDMAKSASKLGP